MLFAILLFSGLSMGVALVTFQEPLRRRGPKGEEALEKL
jgi:hypothetical protein